MYLTRAYMQTDYVIKYGTILHYTCCIYTLKIACRVNLSARVSTANIISGFRTKTTVADNLIKKNYKYARKMRPGRTNLWISSIKINRPQKLNLLYEVSRNNSISPLISPNMRKNIKFKIYVVNYNKNKCLPKKNRYK